ncbi:MAG: hypothetical protein U0350_36960 [Caldilineaceae bacterium]
MRKLAESLFQRGEIKNAYTLASAIADVVQATGKPSLYAATLAGACPFCGDYDEIVLLGRKKYAACHEHRVYWYIGMDQLLAEEEVTALWKKNQNLFRLYTQIAIEAAFPKDVCPCCGLFLEHAPWCITPLVKPTGDF